MKKFNSEVLYIIPLGFLLVVAFILAYAHQGSILIDCGREVYYPKRIIEGSILYKDLFNIYGPISYLYNALLFKIFGSNLNVILTSGILTATSIITFIYLISRLFFDKFLSSSITVLSIMLGCFSFYIFNYVFPYAFAMSYGISAFLISLYTLLWFVRRNNIWLLYLSTFFAGLAIANKYEFLPYVLVFVFIAFKNKLKFKDIFLSLIFLLVVPVLSFVFLFWKGLTLNDLWHNVKDIYAMTHTVTLYYFYTLSGLILKKPTLGILIKNFFITLTPLILIYCGSKFFATSKIKSVILFVLAILIVFKTAGLKTFVFLPVLLFIVTCIFYKNLSVELKTLVISVLLASIKIFWSAALNSYGTYFIPILLIALITYVKKDYQKYISAYLLLLAFTFLILNNNERKYFSAPLKTEKGTYYVDLVYGETSNNIVKFINENSKKTDKILVIPEGLFFNYLTDRKSDDYYNTYLPLYVETFGENRLIDSLKKDSPKYIIMHNLPTTAYYFKSICVDYGYDVCDYIGKEYLPKAFLNDHFKAYIFEKK